MQKTVAVVLGTRPEAIKVAPVIRAMRDDPRFHPVVVSTGQHRQMLDETLQVFGITPDVDLDIMAPRQSLSEVTYRVIQGLVGLLPDLAPDAVMVHGDTATTLAGAISGHQHRIPVIHVEAGLRSGDAHSPFPEESNRRLVGQIAALHLAPTPGNAANLIREGIDESTIVVTGNTVIDALRWSAELAPADGMDEPLLDLDREPGWVVLASAHRRESWGKPLPEIAKALCDVADIEDVRVVVPLHRNPVVRDVMLPIIGEHPHITVVDPLPYLQFCRLMRRSDIIVSDSSGAEEEGPALGKPTLVLRDVTERPEAVRAGTARLVGRTRAGIVREVTRLINDPVAYAGMAEAVNPYGDGYATERVLDAMGHFFGMGPAAAPFISGLHRAGLSPVSSLAHVA
ncbi:non-hydrolyzing UDP-N-acetylglucosamine 2-epimerase [Krasilnikovia sp. M28-CT-15]|uniref:non-hydrolyzing UDP-N-acetylglucosamine 2-epimerase n=1 Tax=Krasilnikovia sp. M28-CT-15 TaxID=3373540 RepID=UPI00387642DB